MTKCPKRNRSFVRLNGAGDLRVPQVNPQGSLLNSSDRRQFKAADWQSSSSDRISDTFNRPMVHNIPAPQIEAHGGASFSILIDHHPQRAISNKCAIVKMLGQEFPDRILPTQKCLPINPDIKTRTSVGRYWTIRYGTGPKGVVQQGGKRDASASPHQDQDKLFHRAQPSECASLFAIITRILWNERIPMMHVKPSKQEFIEFITRFPQKYRQHRGRCVIGERTVKCKISLGCKVIFSVNPNVDFPASPLAVT